MATEVAQHLTGSADLVQGLKARGRLESCYIGGKWRPASGDARSAVIDPSTEEAISEISLGTAADVDAASQAAMAAFEGFSRWTPNERARLLWRVHGLILEWKEELAQLLMREMGAPISYARSAQVPLAAEHVRVAAELAESFSFRSMRGSTLIAKEPIGVCGMITPWNWPLYQITAKVAPALAAGCTIVLKPSELSPLSALLFAELLEEAGTPPGVFNLVNGDGPGVGHAIASHPLISMVSITGSTRAGIEVARAAAPTIKRVTQELGGKSANVVLPDADFERAIPQGVAAAFRNCGQSCSAPTRMIVPRTRLEEVEALAVGAAQSMIVGDPRREETTHGPLANAAQWQRVQDMIGAGIDEHARLICGGLGRPDGIERGFFARPTVFAGVNRDMRIAREEIFGPVLAIIAYDGVDEAVSIANDSEYGLGGHVQSEDKEAARSVALRMRTGQVHINYPAWDPYAPFGGYKHSGNGREYGPEGLEEYLETKAIVGFA
jgi:aldehyde dehydrogenase (NAD+)